ncbi:STAS domain-containing protein [Nonomuraea sp. JJY05]|uniref:STAS domain-containing protein n=1 Tax=Nonomuraea sp. JJY05 TaxID=3350255 RepID=UPI00373EBB63
MISIAGDLDTAGAAQLDAFISRARRHLGDHVVLNLSEVPLLGRSGLRALLNARALTRQHGSDLHLASLQDSSARLLNNTGARPVLAVHHSVEQAILAALHRSLAVIDYRTSFHAARRRAGALGCWRCRGVMPERSGLRCRPRRTPGVGASTTARPRRFAACCGRVNLRRLPGGQRRRCAGGRSVPRRCR